MVQFDPPFRAHVGQRTLFSKWLWVLLGLLGQGSSVALLLDNVVPVSMIIHPIDVSHLGQMPGSVSLASGLVQCFPSGNLLWGGCCFDSWWFGLLLGGTPFTYPLQNLVFVFLMPLPLSLLDRVRISLWHTKHNWGSNQSVGLYLSSCPPITALGPGMVRAEGIWYPWGGPALIFLLSIKPLT